MKQKWSEREHAEPVDYDSLSIHQLKMLAENHDPVAKRMLKELRRTQQADLKVDPKADSERQWGD